MIPTTRSLGQWLRHINGDQAVPVSGRKRLTEAVELNRDGQEIVDTFGNKEFVAAVGFVDMRGFTRRSFGLSPSRVREIASPFVNAVITSAAKRHWIVDKTIGDEVMLILPDFGEDIRLALPELDSGNDLFIEVISLVADLLETFKNARIEEHLSAGFSIGRLVLDRVGTSEYAEWTCYGNVVNIAKRLQCERIPEDKGDSHLLILGANEGEVPDINETLRTWSTIWQSAERLAFVSLELLKKELKGVGEVAFLASIVELKEKYR
jgi:class 3 adenylate cyclase